MANRQIFVRHLFGGGWATDFGPATDILPQGQGNARILQLPFLLEADNVVYELDGGPHKAPGTVKLNSGALESGADIKGIFDFWISGVTAAPTQKRIVHVGAKIKKDDADGSFSDIFTGLESGKVPSYTVLNDLLVMATDSTIDVPKSWDGTTAQNLAGSPPNFAFVVKHKGRLFASGDAANPSKVHYSTFLNPEDWIGLGSGEISVDPDDGDVITGLISHKDELWVFKGPHKGSIHRISGSAPTGGDPFALKLFQEGVGAVGHNTIFRFRDDIGFMWSDGSINSLNATDAFGDFREASLSRPIQTYIRGHAVFDRLKHAYAMNDSDEGRVLFAIPIDTSQQPNIILSMDYRFENVRWSKWPSFGDTCVSLASVIDPTATDRRIVMGGGTDGFVRKYGQSTRSIDGTTAISFKVTAPHLTYGIPIQEKIISGGSIGFKPKNSGDVTFGWTRDNNAQQTQTVAQGGSAVLGSFTLDTDALGGSRFVDQFFELEEGDAFRSVSMEVTHNTNNEDVEIHSISSVLDIGSWSWEN